MSPYGPVRQEANFVKIIGWAGCVKPDSAVWSR
jgi:hypothetical protein